MHALIFEPHHEGHRLTMVRRMLEPLLELPVTVVLTTNVDAPKSAQWREQLAKFEGRFIVDAWMTPEAHTRLGSARDRLRYYRASAKRHQPDHLYVPFADGLIQVDGITGLHFRRGRSQPEVEMLMLRGGFGYPSGQWREGLKRKFSAEMVRRAHWTKLYHMDPRSADYLDTLLKLKGGCQVMPDAVNVRTWPKFEARERLGIPTDGRYLGCVGRIDRRKGMDHLIHAFMSARLRHDDRLLLVGPMTQEIQNQLAGAAKQFVDKGRILFIEKYVTDEIFGAALGAMDLVCTPYPLHEGSASIVIAAAAAQRPVLGSDTGWIGITIPRFGLGWTCNVAEQTGFVRSIESSLDDALSFHHNECSHRFVRFHSVENQKFVWTSRIRERLGLSSLKVADSLSVCTEKC